MELIHSIILLIIINRVKPEYNLNTPDQSVELQGTVVYDSSQMFEVKVILQEGYTVKVRYF